ncbi:hypothetical protein FDUTEX481_09301 [Tolypothrix sp. PCC 7601]|nr:hypothetical protein FDUTEX481_09301 [Tolypothrix sp. PCC 7601]
MPSSPNPFSPGRRGTKSLAPLSWWATVYTEVLKFHLKLGFAL